MGPLRQNGPQRFLLGLVDDLAALPSDRLDQLLDFPFDAIAQIVRVHRVQFPAATPVVGDEPLVARVFASYRLRGTTEGRALAVA